jgi:hypothetical protein
MIVILSSCSTFKSYFWGEKKVIMPTIELPKKPDKPNIKSKVFKEEHEFYVGYLMSDSMKLYKYLVESEGYADKLEFRIQVQNEIIKHWGEK